MSGGYDPALDGVLEPGQLSTAVQTPLPRKVLGRGVVVLLYVMRVYVVVAVPVVIYAFVRALRG